MRAPVTTEVHVHADPERIADAVAGWPGAGHFRLTAEGGWRSTPWTSSRDAWRRDLRWTRGRTAGAGTVDLVPAGDARTLLVLTLAPARGWPFRRPVATTDATALALALRGAVEGAAVGPAPVVPLPSRPATPVAALGPPATAVGYSGP